MVTVHAFQRCKIGPRTFVLPVANVSVWFEDLILFSAQPLLLYQHFVNTGKHDFPMFDGLSSHVGVHPVPIYQRELSPYRWIPWQETVRREQGPGSGTRGGVRGGTEGYNPAPPALYPGTLHHCTGISIETHAPNWRTGPKRGRKVRSGPVRMNTHEQ